MGVFSARCPDVQRLGHADTTTHRLETLRDSDEWRDTPAHVEPLSGVPHGKIRIGDFRLGAGADRESKTLYIYDIEHRSGAYRPDDD
ncbi:type II toxin-antitoxin system RelE/ParE family toxin [Halorubrum ezzemoulense]|uniref:type II toxin-antitoxin system RelE family toxin n=1 Tax=Halorubrum ezzemoulense TaxID=337243 RepID=UPI002330A346|nr:type II toxin-antitoxin system RelE/ParE family toxin [Halorubrum ezzemoulense]MDB2282452.1 type II toxin-antitoxin system RelE/ParE family toxin [Halorubrum ezzemoulense]